MRAMRRELGIGEDQGQARTRGAWMLKPDAFGAMTAILDVPAQRRRKPRGQNGLTGDCRQRDPQDGKSSRNRAAGPTAALSAASHVDCCETPTSVKSSVIATTDAMDASGFEFSRLLYDDQPTGRYRVPGPKSQLGWLIVGLSAPRLDARSRMRQRIS